MTEQALQQRSVMTEMAHRFGMEKAAFEATIKKTIMPAGQDVSNEQLAAFMVVAREYDLNPFTKEIYAFPARGGGIQPIVSIDGWLKIINAHAQFDGMEFDDVFTDGGDLISTTCRMFRKDRKYPIAVTEYMSECRRETDTWKKWPARMLRHKATIQCSRYAFGFSGIVDPDEAERMIEMGAVEVVPASAQAATATIGKIEKLRNEVRAQLKTEAVEELPDQSEPTA